MSASFLSLLNQKNFCTFNRDLAHRLGLHETIFLHALVSKYDQFKYSHPDEEEFYYTVEDVHLDTTLGERAQNTAIRKLVELGLCSKRVKGIPAKRFFTLNVENLARFMGVQIIFTNSCDVQELEPAQSGNQNLHSAGSHYIYKNKNKNKKARAEPTPPLAKATELAFHFIRKLKELKPDMKEPNLKAWEKDMDLMLRRDKRKPEVVENLIDWVVEDDFWHSNVMSPAKLREKFDKLELQMRKKSNKSNAVRVNEMQQWLRTGPLQPQLLKAFNQRKVKIESQYIEFVGVPDGKILYTDKKAEELIEHNLRKLNI